MNGLEVMGGGSVVDGLDNSKDIMFVREFLFADGNFLFFVWQQSFKDNVALS